MSKSRGKTRWNLIFILLAAFILSFAGYKYFIRQVQPVNIMVIDSLPIKFGDTTISGGLHKDINGNFIIVLPDLRVVTLDVRGIDNLVGIPVTVAGILYPAKDSSSTMTMAVEKITIAAE